MSGHIFFADGYYGFDDAVYVAVRLLDVLIARPHSLAEMRDRLPPSSTRRNCAFRARSPQIRGRARGPRALAQGGRRDDRHRRRARAHCRRLVAAARLEHPGGPRRPRRIGDRGRPCAPQAANSRPNSPRAAWRCPRSPYFAREGSYRLATFSRRRRNTEHSKSFLCSAAQALRALRGEMQEPRAIEALLVSLGRLRRSAAACPWRPAGWRRPARPSRPRFGAEGAELDAPIVRRRAARARAQAAPLRPCRPAKMRSAALPRPWCSSARLSREGVGGGCPLGESWCRRRPTGVAATRHHGAPRDADFGEALVEQRGHLAVARAGRRPAHDHPDQPVPIAHRRGRQIEARGADIAGLDPVGALVPVEQVVVAVDDAAAKIELAGRKIAVFAREIAVEGERQSGHRRAPSCAGRDRAGRKRCGNRAGHPELAGLPRHLLGKVGLAAGQPLGEHRGGVIRRFGDDAEDQVVHRQSIRRV